MRRPALLVLLMLTASLLVATPARADPVFTVWMSATGSDANDGTEFAPVRTLERVEQLIAGASSDVEVRITQGTYDIGETFWTTYIPGHTISFMPIDFEVGEGLSGIAGRPVFQGTGDWWFEARLPSGHPGGTTGLRFYYLRVEGYRSGGIFIHGGYHTVDGKRVPSTAGANGNEIRGMYFYQLGSLHNPGPYGYAGVDLVNSSDNYLRANHFLYLENAAPYWSHIHGVYLAHGSSRNEIVNNKFRFISGDPVRIRNLSDDNDIYGNTFERTAKKSYFSDWFCGPTCEPPDGVECASQGNLFHDNILVSGYDGVQVPDVLLYPAGMSYPGGAGCAALAGPRVTTYGNT